MARLRNPAYYGTVPTYIEVDSLLVDRHLWVEGAYAEESLYGAGVESVAELVQHLLQLVQQVHHPAPEHEPFRQVSYIRWKINL